MKSLCLLLLALIVADCSRHVPPLRTLRAEALKMVSLAQDKSYDEYTDLTYPTLIEAAGGRYEFIETLRLVYRRAAERDVEILGIEVGDPADTVVSEGKVFAIVPTVTKIDTPASTITKKGYLLAVSGDDGVTWKFIDGTALTAVNTYRLVPDLPSGLKFPKDEPPIVVKKPAPEPSESPTPAAAPSRSTLQIKTIEVANALVAGAYHEFVADLYPPMVAGLGGSDKAAAFYRDTYHSIHDAGRILASSVEVDEPGEFATQGRRTFAVVPVTFKGENAKRKLVRRGAFLAISEDGGVNWTFIPGITPKIAASLRTVSLPPDLKIPEPQPQVVTDK